MKYQTVNRRILALFIDALIINVLVYAVNSIGGNLSSNITHMISFIYIILFHTLSGSTIGKRILRIQVYDISESRLPSLAQSFLRELIYLTLFIIPLLLNAELLTEPPWSYFWLLATPVFAIVDVAFALTNSKSRTIHDYLSKTVLVRSTR